jgi:hypothetical protein
MKALQKLALAGAFVVGFAVPAAYADTLIYKAAGIELEIKKGAFSSDDRRAVQLLTIKNHSTIRLSYVSVECGFFHGDLLIGRDTEMVTSIEPGQDGYAEIRAYVLSADRTDCRFSNVSR